MFKFDNIIGGTWKPSFFVDKAKIEKMFKLDSIVEATFNPQP
jgi:hypothetical protein